MSTHAGSAADARFMCNPSRMGHSGTMLECVIVIVVKAEPRVYIAPLGDPTEPESLSLDGAAIEVGVRVHPAGCRCQVWVVLQHGDLKVQIRRITPPLLGGGQIELVSAHRRRFEIAGSVPLVFPSPSATAYPRRSARGSLVLR